jgi:hypothetical protein
VKEVVSMKDEEIRVVIINPKCIPIAKERLVKFLYDEYVKEISEEDIKKLSDKQ